jgi:excisionase family DNA binding protein
MPDGALDMPPSGMSTQAGAIDDRLMTEKEAAEYLRIKTRQLYYWRVSGLIPFIRIGRALRFRKSAIDAALVRMTRGIAA